MAKRPNNQQQKPKELSPNQKVELQQSLNQVLKALVARRGEVEDVLPPDVPFENFYATVNQALRNSPEVLEASPVSIVNACVKAAYDGLRPDGREAAIVVHNVNIGTYDNPVYEKHAQYFPMVFGLIQQILRGGEVLAIEAEVVYENDEWRLTRGTNGEVFHEPCMTGETGPMLFAYTVATLKSGVKTTAFLRKHEVEDVMQSSQSGWDKYKKEAKGVWKRWPRQMWLKTVLRFHRKTLPLGERNAIADMEQRDLFPDMQRAENPHGLIGHNLPPRPTRQQQTQQLEDNSGNSGGVDLGFGNQPAREEEHVAAAGKKVEASKAEAEPSKASTKASAAPLPVGDDEWNAWLVEFERKLVAAQDQAAVDSLVADEKACREAAPQKTREWINGIITDRLAELASDAAANQAQSDGNDNSGSGASS